MFVINVSCLSKPAPSPKYNVLHISHILIFLNQTNLEHQSAPTDETLAAPLVSVQDHLSALAHSPSLFQSLSTTFRNLPKKKSVLIFNFRRIINQGLVTSPVPLKFDFTFVFILPLSPIYLFLCDCY